VVEVEVQGVIRFVDAGLVDDKLVCGPERPTLAQRGAVLTRLIGWGDLPTGRGHAP
jgi:hypothetical protein